MRQYPRGVAARSRRHAPEPRQLRGLSACRRRCVAGLAARARAEPDTLPVAPAARPPRGGARVDRRIRGCAAVGSHAGAQLDLRAERRHPLASPRSRRRGAHHGARVRRAREDLGVVDATLVVAEPEQIPSAIGPRTRVVFLSH